MKLWSTEYNILEDIYLIYKLILVLLNFNLIILKKQHSTYKFSYCIIINNRTKSYVWIFIELMTISIESTDNYHLLIIISLLIQLKFVYFQKIQKCLDSVGCPFKSV